MKRFALILCCIVVAVTAVGQTKTVIYFDSDQSSLGPQAMRTLDSLANVFSAAKSSAIEIKAYCDNTGTEEHNQALSEQRAKAVRGYFENKNVHDIVVSSAGLGRSSPASDNSTENGKALNRRAEILVTIVRNEPKAEAPPIVAEAPKPVEKKEPGLMKKPEELKEDIKYEELQPGQILLLKNLNFEGGTANLLQESKPSLQLLLKLLKEHPTLEIEIEGHVCCATDMRLSVDRALTVLEYLVRNGISEKRLTYQGHSNNNPITEERNEEERIINRRVEIMVMKK